MKTVASRITGFLLLYACFSPIVALAGQDVSRPSGALRIVVIEGEDAVNVIQQKTAVAPVVEVRDHNGLPVPGAVVRFTIGGGNASFTGGSQTLTITTNAAGRAAASAVNPLASGSVQIQVQATFQGQSAAATIAQTNVATAAQAAGVTAAGVTAVGAAGAGAGGGGVSGLAIAGIAGGVGAGAAVFAVQKGNADEEEGDADEQADAAIDPAVQAASGRYVLQQINGVGLPAVSVPSPPNSCPVVTDNATLTLTARPQVFELSENSRNDCRIGANISFQSSVGGSWSLQAGTVTLVLGGAGSVIDFGPATLTGSTLTMLWGPPHVETGKQTARLNTVWVK